VSRRSVIVAGACVVIALLLVLPLVLVESDLDVDEAKVARMVRARMEVP